MVESATELCLCDPVLMYLWQALSSFPRRDCDCDCDLCLCDDARRRRFSPLRGLDGRCGDERKLAIQNGHEVQPKKRRPGYGNRQWSGE